MIPTTLSMKELFVQRVVVPNVMAADKLVERRLTLNEIMVAMDVPNTLQSVMGQISREEIFNWMRNWVPAKLLWEAGDIINQTSTAYKRKVIEIVDSKCKRIKLEDVKLNTIAVKTK